MGRRREILHNSQVNKIRLWKILIWSSSLSRYILDARIKQSADYESASTLIG